MSAAKPKERSRLKDFDWKLQYILGSSSLANHQDSLVTLQLYLTRDNNSVAKTPNIKDELNLELNKNELDKLISTLENCQQKLLRTN